MLLSKDLASSAQKSTAATVKWQHSFATLLKTWPHGRSTAKSQNHAIEMATPAMSCPYEGSIIIRIEVSVTCTGSEASTGQPEAQGTRPVITRHPNAPSRAVREAPRTNTARA